MKPCTTPKPRRRSSAKSAAEAANNPITPQDIARLAHSYWEARGGTGGSPEDDWLRAERELNARGTSQTSAAAA
jgi:Protein of unknown function (DUF2934)